MEQLTDRVTDAMVERMKVPLGRRTFLGRMVRFAAATGMVLAGASRLAAVTYAASCCISTTGVCSGCPTPCGSNCCPAACSVIQDNGQCCDTATGQVHSCTECRCGLGLFCHCEVATGSSC